MLAFLVRRSLSMIVTALCLTFIVFWLTNLGPNLEKIAKTEAGSRISDEEVASWLEKNGFGGPLIARYGEWLGILPGWTVTEEDGTGRGRCVEPGQELASSSRYCGILQGDWGESRVFRAEVIDVVARGLSLTAKLMFWVLVVMIPGSLLLGVLAGMREGSRTDRVLSTGAIVTTATPEYVSGVVFIAVFTSSAVGLKWFNGSAPPLWKMPTLLTSPCPC
jgi:peptide/nickel transport system permease protein